MRERMGFNNDRVLPQVINFSMRNRELQPYRERVIGQASGRVLEIGVGSSLKLLEREEPRSRLEKALRRVPAAGASFRSRVRLGAARPPWL